jgi:hypothetical protein
MGLSPSPRLSTFTRHPHRECASSERQAPTMNNHLFFEGLSLTVENVECSVDFYAGKLGLARRPMPL